MQVKLAMASSRCYDNSDVIVILTITNFYVHPGGWGGLGGGGGGGGKGGISKEICGTVHPPV